MENDLFNSPRVGRAYLQLAMPLVFSMVVSLIYNLADTFFVAQTNNTALVAGVSLATPLFTLLMAVGNIFAQGGSSLISRYLGQQDRQAVRRISCFCFYTTILVGVVIGVVMLLFRRPILGVLGADDQTFPHASAYYFYLALGAPILILSFIHSNLLRSEGMSRQSMIGTILGAVINIVLDPIFISGLGLGAAGAAIATIIGYLGSDLYFLAVVLRRSKVLSVLPAEYGASPRQVVQILTVGIILARTYYKSIPLELHEAAALDGASELQYFFRILIPVCKPIIAVLVLYQFVGMWNSYFDAMIYLEDQSLQPLQLVIRSILVQNTPRPGMVADAQNAAMMAKIAEQLKYSTIVVSSLPLLVMYPFFQKYFEKGVMLGSVKG